MPVFAKAPSRAEPSADDTATDTVKGNTRNVTSSVQIFATTTPRQPTLQSEIQELRASAGCLDGSEVSVGLISAAVGLGAFRGPHISLLL